MFKSYISWACLKAHPDDYNSLIEAVMKIEGCQFVEAKERVSLAEIRAHCRTQIPPKEELRERLDLVYDYFCDQKSSSGEKLFTERMQYVWKLNMVHVENGCLSDPPDTLMHRKLRDVKFRHSDILLPLYATCRSSSQLEGCHHSVKGGPKGTSLGDRASHAVVMDSGFYWNQNRLRDMGMPHCPVKDTSLYSDAAAAYQRAFGKPVPGCFEVAEICNKDIEGGGETKEVFGLKYALEQREELAAGKRKETLTEPSESLAVPPHFQPEATVSSALFAQEVQEVISKNQASKKLPAAGSSHKRRSASGKVVPSIAKWSAFTPDMQHELRGLQQKLGRKNSRDIFVEYEKKSRLVKDARKHNEPLSPQLLGTNVKQIEKFLLVDRNRSAAAEAYVPVGPSTNNIFSLLPSASSEGVPGGLFPAAPPTRKRSPPSSPADNTRGAKRRLAAQQPATPTPPTNAYLVAAQKTLECIEQGSLTLERNQRRCGECKKLPLTNDAGHAFIRIPEGSRRYCPLTYPNLDDFLKRVLPQKLKSNKEVCQSCWKAYSGNSGHVQLVDDEGKELDIWYCPDQKFTLKREGSPRSLSHDEWMKRFGRGMIASMKAQEKKIVHL